jgi:transposase
MVERSFGKLRTGFMEAGKGWLKGDSLREANGAEVETLKQENQRLKELVAQLSLENLVLKKSLG